MESYPPQTAFSLSAITEIQRFLKELSNFMIFMQHYLVSVIPYVGGYLRAGKQLSLMYLYQSMQVFFRNK